MEATRLEHMEVGLDHVGGSVTSPRACEARSTSAESAGQ